MFDHVVVVKSFAQSTAWTRSDWTLRTVIPVRVYLQDAVSSDYRGVDERRTMYGSEPSVFLIGFVNVATPNASATSVSKTTKKARMMACDRTRMRQRIRSIYTIQRTLRTQRAGRIRCSRAARALPRTAHRSKGGGSAEGANSFAGASAQVSASQVTRTRCSECAMFHQTLSHECPACPCDQDREDRKGGAER